MKSLAQRFLDHVGLTDNNIPIAAAAMGLTDREFELFLGALNAVGDSDASFAIPNLNGVAKTVSVSPVYIQHLKRAEVVERGASKGEWNLTRKVMRKAEAFLKDVAAGVTPTPAERAKGRVVPTAVEKKKRAPKEVGEMNTSEIKESLLKIDADIERLKTKCVEDLKAVQNKCDDDIASLQLARQKIVAFVNSMLADIQ